MEIGPITLAGSQTRNLVIFDFNPAMIGAFFSGVWILIGKSVSPSKGQVSTPSIGICRYTWVSTYLQFKPEGEELKDFAGWVTALAWSPKEANLLASWDTSFTARLWQV